MKCRDCPKFSKSGRLTRPGLCKVDANPRWPGEECDLNMAVLGHFHRRLEGSVVKAAPTGKPSAQ